MQWQKLHLRIAREQVGIWAISQQHFYHLEAPVAFAECGAACQMQGSKPLAVDICIGLVILTQVLQGIQVPLLNGSDQGNGAVTNCSHFCCSALQGLLASSDSTRLGRWRYGSCRLGQAHAFL